MLGRKLGWTQASRSESRELVTRCAVSKFGADANLVVSGVGARGFCRSLVQKLSAQGDAWAFRAGTRLLAPDSGDPTGGKLSGDDPHSRYSLRSAMDLPGGFELDGWLRYVGELPSPRVAAYTELDVHLGWHWGERLKLALVGQNLLHAHHVEFAPSPFVEAVQRSVYGKVTWHF